MLTPPSLHKKHGICWSRDPALAVPDDPTRAGDEDDDAYAKRRDAVREGWMRRVRQARETGEWGPLLLDGQQPTVFDVRPMPSETFRAILDALRAKQIGPVSASAIAFRACVRAVENFGDLQVETVRDERFGRLAAVALTDALDALDPAIVAELGEYCFERARGPSGK